MTHETHPIGTGERLPCPFKHEVKLGTFIYRDDEDFEIVRVACGDCGCSGPFVDTGDDRPTADQDAEAVALWNDRLSTLRKDEDER